MEKGIFRMLQDRGASFWRFLDISPYHDAVGYSRAIVFGLPLPKDFIKAIYFSHPTPTDAYLEAENRVEALADRLAESIRIAGYHAYSQSERSNIAAGFVESKYILPEIQTGPSPLPQKTLARLGGLGFIGKNNLLITKEYGCGVALCSVLTDAPIATRAYSPIENRCGRCSRCIQICPCGALSGRSWSAPGKREQLLDIRKCACPLKCMIHCPWTLHYAGIAMSDRDS